MVSNIIFATFRAVTITKIIAKIIVGIIVISSELNLFYFT
jgi:hypothetical protein